MWGVHRQFLIRLCTNWLGGYAWDYYVAMVFYFLTTGITLYLIEGAKKFLDKKIARTKDVFMS